MASLQCGSPTKSALGDVASYLGQPLTGIDVGGRARVRLAAAAAATRVFGGRRHQRRPPRPQRREARVPACKGARARAFAVGCCWTGAGASCAASNVRPTPCHARSCQHPRPTPTALPRDKRARGLAQVFGGTRAPLVALHGADQGRARLRAVVCLGCVHCCQCLRAGARPLRAARSRLCGGQARQGALVHASDRNICEFMVHPIL